MNRYLYPMGAWVLVCGLAANGQTGGGAAAGGNAAAAVSATSSAQGTASTSQGVDQNQNQNNQSQNNYGAAYSTNGAGGSQAGTLPPGLEKRDQLPPGLQNRQQLPPGLAKRTNEVVKTYDQPNHSGTNQFSGTYGGSNQFGATVQATNQFGAAAQGTDQFGTRFGATNQNQFGSTSAQSTNNYGYRRTSTNSLTPTGRTGGTNQTSATAGGTASTTANQKNAASQDQAVTATDRTLLVNVRQQVAPQLRLSTGAWMPVHFTVNAGVVTIVGVVETIEIKRQIETIVVQVPGVVRVQNELTIGAGDAAVSGTVGTAGSPDEVLLTRVRQTVLPQVHSSGTVQIDFNVQNGTVMIMGQVPNFEEKRRIAALVKQVPGVTGVTDQTIIPLNAVPRSTTP